MKNEQDTEVSQACQRVLPGDKRLCVHSVQHLGARKSHPLDPSLRRLSTALQGSVTLLLTVTPGAMPAGLGHHQRPRGRAGACGLAGRVGSPRQPQAQALRQGGDMGAGQGPGPHRPPGSAEPPTVSHPVVLQFPRLSNDGAGQLRKGPGRDRGCCQHALAPPPPL